MPAANQTARLEARITPDLHARLKHAADLEGRTVTDFVITAVQEAANRAIAQAGLFQMSLADQQAFAEALCNPPPAAPALKRAFVRRRSLLSAE